MPEEYGYVALITVFTGFIVIFTDAGLSFAIIRSDYKETFHKAMVNLAFFIGLLLFIIMVALAYPIALFYRDNTLVLPTSMISLMFIIGALRIIPEATISKSLNFTYIGKVKLIGTLIIVGIMIILALLGFSYWLLIIPPIFSQTTQYILFEKKARIGLKIYSFSYTLAAFRKTKSLITNLSGFNIINYWARNADNLIIGKYYGSFDLGILTELIKC
jgi:O-antigen/teichoic acid export membrane protein